MSDHMQPWGNGRPEFRIQGGSADFINAPALVKKLPPDWKYMNWAQRLAHHVYSQIGSVSYAIKYTDNSGGISERVVTPFAVSLSQGKWGMFAMCELRNATRWFLFDRLVGIDPVPLVREPTPQETSLRLLVLKEQEQTTVMDALRAVDPELYEKIMQRGQRPRRKLRGKKSPNTKTEDDEASRNSEGLTWMEGAHAANVSLADGGTLKERKSWWAGVDPAEYRAKQPRLKSGKRMPLRRVMEAQQLANMRKK